MLLPSICNISYMWSLLEIWGNLWTGNKPKGLFYTIFLKVKVMCGRIYSIKQTICTENALWFLKIIHYSIHPSRQNWWKLHVWNTCGELRVICKGGPCVYLHGITHVNLSQFYPKFSVHFFKLFFVTVCL